jgi:tRNA uridine 5-carboxymethylaminomethyl modification enzyme
VRLSRFKTGTPPRLWARSLDVERQQPQLGDTPPRPLSNWTDLADFPRLPQRCCWLTHTAPETHAVVRKNLDRSPLYAGRIQGRGPRYCPSLEDKVVRFADRERHAVFLEPEGVDSPLVYPAGLSTSLPLEVQVELLQTMPGLERAEVAQPGYAVEYDCVPATQLDRRLALGETGLFLAGQMNGTSGYEEAAVQGFWAGVNAARAATGEGAWGLPRERAHLAVLVDELVGRELEEPFRMFTSRSHERLTLREGNADLRLADEGRLLGLLDRQQAARVASRRQRIGDELVRLRSVRLKADAPTRAALTGAGVADFSAPATLAELVARPGVSWRALARVFPAGAPALSDVDAEEVEAELKYAGYARRSERERSRTEGRAAQPIPTHFRYSGLPGLTREAQERLTSARPRTLAEAAALPGVTAAAVAILALHLARNATGASPCA